MSGVLARGNSYLARILGAEARLRDRWMAETAPLPSPARAEVGVLIGIVILGGVLRFATLDARSFWIDEAVVVILIEDGLGDMLERLLTGEEGTPPLYYILAWGWSGLFGTGEVALRSLSAILGTASIPVAWVAGRELLSARGGVIAAILFAASPILVWHSQDARAHTLALLLAALSFVLFVRLLREPRGSRLAWWAAVSALGILSHYFVVFPVAAEALWLLVAFRGHRGVRVAIGAVAVAGAGAIAVALQQQSNVDLTYRLYPPLEARLVQVPAQLLVGEQPPLQRTMPVVATLLVVPALVLLVKRGGGAKQSGAAIAGAIGGLALIAMLTAAVVGADYISARNLLPLLLPALLVVAAGFGASSARRLAIASLGALASLWLAINVSTAGVPKFEREDWRGAAGALGEPEGDRAVVVTPFAGRGPMAVYLSETDRMPRAGARVDEIDMVGLAPLFRAVGESPRPPRPASPPPVPDGFRLVELIEERYYTVARFRARGPLPVDPGALGSGALGEPPATVLLQRGRG